MIVLDIETSGLDTGKCGIWQIGALELENPKNYFLEEGRIDNEDEVAEEALKIIGKTEEELRDQTKQSQRQIILNYFDWAKNVREKITTGQNVGWDISFIQNKCIRYGILDKYREVTGQRTIDLHTIAQENYKKLHGRYSLNKKGKSDMSLSEILNFCGLKDNRIRIEGEKIIQQGKNHESLEDCRLEGECVFRINYGKNLFPEYSQFEVPEYLRSKNGR